LFRSEPLGANTLIIGQAASKAKKRSIHELTRMNTNAEQRRNSATPIRIGSFEKLKP
jgi:hypothetical protein